MMHMCYILVGYIVLIGIDIFYNRYYHSHIEINRLSVYVDRHSHINSDGFSSPVIAIITNH